MSGHAAAEDLGNGLCVIVEVELSADFEQFGDTDVAELGTHAEVGDAEGLDLARRFDGLIRVQRGVGMYVCEGAAAALRDRERAAFLKQEWPQIRARMDRLGIDIARLLDEI